MKPAFVNYFTLALFTIITFSSCLTTKKYDTFVSAQYNDQLPAVAIKKKANNVHITSEVSSNTDKISNTIKTNKTLPLLLYWKVDNQYVCDLNTQLAVGNFAKAYTTASVKNLDKVLDGKQLDLVVKQVPSAFSMVYKENILIVIVATISWRKVYMHPEVKDLIVSYTFHQSDSTVKTGTITVKNKLQDQNFRIFQSWQSATSEYIMTYDEEVANMAKEFVNKLTEELTQ